MAISPAELVRRVGNVGSVQSIYHRLTEVINHPFSSATDVGKVIAEDPDLTARLLRLVNSPIYGFPGRIGTVTQAISIVGMNQLQDLALGASFIRTFGSVPQDLVDMSGFWRHSVACAVAARSLAVIRREPNAERLFVAGLLHDIGRPVMYLHLPEESRQVLERCRRTGELQVKVETEELGYHHGQVGAALLDHWRLPSVLQEAVAWHHSPRLAARYPVEASMVHVADHVANAFRLGTSGEQWVPPLLPDAWERLGLAPEAISTVLHELEHRYREAVAAVVGGDD